MKFQVSLIVWIFSLVSMAYSDVPSTSFVVLRTEDVVKILNKRPKPTDLSDDEIYSNQIAHGGIQGNCSLAVNIKDVHFSMKFHEEIITNPPIQHAPHPQRGAYFYRLGIKSPITGIELSYWEGYLDIGTTWAVDPNWQKNKYVVLFKFENLKR